MDETVWHTNQGVFDEGSIKGIMAREALLQRAYELGFRYEKAYHGCAQCAVAAIQDTLGLKDDGTFKAANAMNAGVGCSSRGTCGALAGSVMVISSLCGRTRTRFDDVDRIRARPYGPAQRLLEKFENEYGSGICGEIQRRLIGRSFNLLVPEQRDMFLEAGAEDMKTEESTYAVTTSPADYENVKKALDEKKVAVEAAEITNVPKNTIKITGENAKKVIALVSELEDNDDIQNVYANFDIPDEILKAEE